MFGAHVWSGTGISTLRIAPHRTAQWDHTMDRWPKRWCASFHPERAIHIESRVMRKHVCLHRHVSIHVVASFAYHQRQMGSCGGNTVGPMVLHRGWVAQLLDRVCGGGKLVQFVVRIPRCFPNARHSIARVVLQPLYDARDGIGRFYRSMARVALVGLLVTHTATVLARVRRGLFGAMGGTLVRKGLGGERVKARGGGKGVD